MTATRLILCCFVIQFAGSTAAFAWQQSSATSQAEPQTSDYALPASDDGLPGEGPIRRYGWFTKLWQNRRAEFAAQAKDQQAAVVFFGDSITQGWGPTMKDSFPGMSVANRGISGDTTRGMLIRLQQDVLSLKPSAVVLLMGTNDLEEGATPETIASNIQLIINELKKHNSEIPLIVCNVFPSSETKKRSATDIKAVNALVGAAVKGDAQVTVVDTWTLFADKNGDAKKAEFPDLLHPNNIGYSKWAKALTPLFESLQLLKVDTQTFAMETGFRSLFNGKDLTGWSYQPTTQSMLKGRARWQQRDPNAPAWPIVEQAIAFDGQPQSTDGRYAAINGRLVVKQPAERRRIQQLWTTEEFDGDFTLRLEFRAMPNADSGVFIRQPQLQCRDYLLAGPYKDLANYRAQDWNELEVEVRGETARCLCNGEVIEDNFKVPAKGPIGLEGDRGQIEYRRIRIRKD